MNLVLNQAPVELFRLSVEWLEAWSGKTELGSLFKSDWGFRDLDFITAMWQAGRNRDLSVTG